MEQIITTIQFLLNDTTIFVILEVFIFGTFLFSITKKRKNFSDRYTKKLRTGDLVLAYSIISASIIQALSAVSFFAEFKLGVILTNLVVSFYLCFFSAWFQYLIAHVSLKVVRKARSN